MFRHLMGAAVIVGLSSFAASASHNRGSVLIPSIDGNGNLTIEATSFWRTTFVAAVDVVSIGTPGGGSLSLNMGADTLNTSDTRFTRTDETASTNISNYGQGLYTISWNSCCRVAGISNTAETNMGTTSTIFWDGTSVNPISFDIQNIQPNVPRGVAYSDNLDVTSPDGHSLSYDDSVLTVGIDNQAPGYSIDSMGQINMSAATTAAYVDNSAGNDGADVAFSGQINAKDGNKTVATVQFDWLFDAVDSTGDNPEPPQIQDVVINATVGDTINQFMTATDPNLGDSISLSFLSFDGVGGAIIGSTFTPGAAGNPTDGTFAWDSTGFAPGTYIATFLASDGSLTDQGTLRINLTDGTTPPSAIPLPAGFLLLGTALAGLGLSRRRRS